MAKRSYTREEMEEILRRAAQRTASDEDAVRHDDLVAAAREVGIDEGAIDHVVEELGGEQETTAIVTRHVRRERARFWRRLSTFVIVMAFLGALDILTPGGPWAQWVALVWGLFLSLFASRAFLPPTSEHVEKLVLADRKKREREAKREARRKAAESWTRRWRELGEETARAARERAEAPSPGARLRSTEKQIDRAIEDGVTALVEALAKRALSAAERIASPATPAARSDFDRYVEREKSAVTRTPVDDGRRPSPPREVIVTPPPRTRVHPGSDDAAAEDEQAETERSKAARRRTR
jgi:hypothetical protein